MEMDPSAPGYIKLRKNPVRKKLRTRYIHCRTRCDATRRRIGFWLTYSTASLATRERLCPSPSILF